MGVIDVDGEMAREDDGEGVRIQASGVNCSAWCRSGTGATISGYELLYAEKKLAISFADGLSPLGEAYVGKEDEGRTWGE